MRRTILAAVAILAGILPLAILVSGCAVRLNGQAVLFRDLDPKPKGAEAEQLLADQRLILALGCSSQSVESALVALGVPQQEAARRALMAFAAMGRSGGCYPLAVPTPPAGVWAPDQPGPRPIPNAGPVPEIQQ